MLLFDLNMIVLIALVLQLGENCFWHQHDKAGQLDQHVHCQCLKQHEFLINDVWLMVDLPLYRGDHTAIKAQG